MEPQRYTCNRCNRDLQQRPATETYTRHLQQTPATETCNKDLQQRPATETCNRDLQQLHLRAVIELQQRPATASTAVKPQVPEKIHADTSAPSITCTSGLVSV